MCQCYVSESFGKYCEYSLLHGETFAKSAEWQLKMRKDYLWSWHNYSDIVCYHGLSCDSGMLCLDWRDICDGVQQCMAGLDEDNCDLLEFNECEDDEYRCMNGMCVPDQYFLDGTYDCMDLSDEKQLFDDDQCAYELASIMCDDRLCPPTDWSCGDGQCIADRITSQLGKVFDDGCESRRDQYHMCETNHFVGLWTLSNGKCYAANDHGEMMAENPTSLDECIHFIRCALSQGVDESCPCHLDLTCLNEKVNPCPSSPPVAYPRRPVLAPYIVQYYNATHKWTQKMPDFIEINGIIRCQRHLKAVQMRLPYPKTFNLHDLEAWLCHASTQGLQTTEPRIHPYCNNESRTFNDRLYHWVDACQSWPPCISAYRIRDGIRNCPNGRDETLTEIVMNTCATVKRHRFRCSPAEPTCLYANSLGNFRADCQNNTDEIWANSDTLLSNVHCNIHAERDCKTLRDYMETSWATDLHTWSMLNLKSIKAIPYRTYCDTFWNLASTNDENLKMCREWWVVSQRPMAMCHRTMYRSILGS